MIGCSDSLLSESLENVSVQGNFLNATENKQKFKVLENCLRYYIKVRSYAHAKFVIENYRTERKKKALRKKLKLSEEDD